LRSPVAVEGAGGAVPASIKEARGHFVMLRDQVLELASNQGLKVSRKETNLLPTPAVGHIRNNDESIEDYLGRRQDYLDGKTKGMPGASLGVAVRMAMLPTPKALDGVKGNLKTSQERLDSGHQVDLPNVAIDLLQTPQVDDSKNTGHNQTRRKTLASQIWETSRTMSWGKYEPAIRRWESVLGRSAPAPTNPDGKEGAHRLAAEFVEWMMGLPEGWVCDPEIGLKRNDQLKALGNGVVPQQAEMALQLLIDDEVLNKLGKK
jgi:hypothetical protein